MLGRASQTHQIIDDICYVYGCAMTQQKRIGQFLKSCRHRGTVLLIMREGLSCGLLSLSGSETILPTNNDLRAMLELSNTGRAGVCWTIYSVKNRPSNPGDVIGAKCPWISGFLHLSHDFDVTVAESLYPALARLFL
jgi:hypothetical protein